MGQEARELGVAVDGEAVGDLHAQLEEVVVEPQPHVLAAVPVGLDAWPESLVCLVQALQDGTRGRTGGWAGPVLCCQFLKSEEKSIVLRNMFIQSTVC